MALSTLLQPVDYTSSRSQEEKRELALDLTGLAWEGGSVNSSQRLDFLSYVRTSKLVPYKVNLPSLLGSCANA